MYYFVFKNYLVIYFNRDRKKRVIKEWSKRDIIKLISKKYTYIQKYAYLQLSSTHINT